MALALIAGACAGDDAEPDAAPPRDDAGRAMQEPADARAWPVPDWEETTPEQAGLDRAALEEMVAAAEAGGSECLVVTHDGRLVGEWYWKDFEPDTERETFSASKSVTSTLVGIAQDQGHLDIGQPASDFIEEWQGTPSEDVTIRNLLANDSGRFQNFDTDYAQMAGAAEDKTAFAIALEQEHEPGTEWVYNNAAIQTLEAVLEEATGQPVTEYADEVLFGPLGMDSEIRTDAAGNALTFMGVQASCRDMARFGLLFEREGEWAGEQVVSSEWVAEATSPSQDLRADYGYLWWLAVPASGDGADEPVYAALGLQNQVVAVFPELDIVVTRLGAGTGDDGASAFGFGQIVDGIAVATGDESIADAETGREGVGAGDEADDE